MKWLAIPALAGLLAAGRWWARVLKAHEDVHGDRLTRPLKVEIPMPQGAAMPMQELPRCNGTCADCLVTRVTVEVA